MLHQIKNQLSGTVVFEGDYPNIHECLLAAIKADANLEGANLRAAYLHGANLESAYLRGANLRAAYLRGAYREGAYLRGANLRGARLEGANLLGAYLLDANLRGARLDGANLRGANLLGANLEGATKSLGGPVRRAARADGCEFFLWPTDAGWRVKAGCRFFDMDKVWQHLERTRGGTALGDESLDILTMFELHIQRAGGE